MVILYHLDRGRLYPPIGITFSNKFGTGKAGGGGGRFYMSCRQEKTPYHIYGRQMKVSVAIGDMATS